MIAEIAAESENMHKDIVSAKYISVMADGATDKGILENEAVCVRLLNDEGVCENRYVALIEVENAHAEGVRAAINNVFETVQIENISEKLIAFAADGASVNMGSKNGVQARLRQDTPHLVDMWCMPHTLELSVSDTLKQAKTASTVLDIMELIYKTYHYSPKSRRELKKYSHRTQQQRKDANTRERHSVAAPR